jgi:hypothetical protein
LINPVFIAVERQQAAVAAQADRVERIEDDIGPEGRERVQRESIHRRYCKVVR